MVNGMFRRLVVIQYGSNAHCWAGLRSFSHVEVTLCDVTILLRDIVTNVFLYLK